MQSFNRITRAVAAAAFGAGLASCSEYLNRRDGLSLQSGNTVESNKVSQMVDPWPRYSGDRDIAYNGPAMDSAVERYRTGRAIPPNGNSTSGAYAGTQQNGNGGVATSGQPTAPPPPAIK